MNKSPVYQYGNTIRFECKFFDFNGANIDPQLIKFILYNTKYEKMTEKVLIENNRTEVGEYYYDHVAESIEQKFYYEWYGEINGTPSLKRGQFATVFI